MGHRPRAAALYAKHEAGLGRLRRWRWRSLVQRVLRTRYRGPFRAAFPYRPWHRQPLGIKGQARQSRLSRRKKTAFSLRPNLPFFPATTPW